MENNIPIVLDAHSEQFIAQQIQNGNYSTASEVVRDALQLLEEQEINNDELDKLLEEGVQSGFIENFDWNEFKEKMKKKYSGHKL
jgi:antitoxin ParD1/3/4